MHVSVDRTANLRCAIHKRFAFSSPQTEICLFFCANKENWMRRVSFPCTGCPFHAPGVLCSSQIHGELINHVLFTHRMQTAQCVSGALVYTKLQASYTRAHQMVRELLTNGLRTKWGNVWMGLQTCAVPSANSSHTVRCKPKFVGSLRKHRELDASGVLFMHRVFFARLRFVEN